jgi:hypothetical protein
VILCDKLKAQLLYHVISVIGVNEFTEKQIEFANTFHKIPEIPELQKKIES